MEDIGKQKAGVAGKRIKELNPNLKTTIYDKNMTEELADKIINEYDMVVDCLDNFETRFILSDACVKAKKPLVHAGVSEYYGQLMTIIPGKGPCLRCIFPNGIRQRDCPSVLTVPVIGPTPGVLGSMQAMEVAKYLLGQQVCSDGIVTYNGLEQSLEKIKIEPNPNCICSQDG